jgi:peptidoglycan/LPS O-acetylase OafA/YrhL
LPPFYLVLLVATLATAIFYPPGSLSDHAVMARAFQFTNYWTIYHDHAGEPKGTGLYWSLAVEEHFYILFPILYVALQRLRLSPPQQALFFWSLCAAVLLWRLVLVLAFHASENRIYLASDTRIDSILFGCALAVWHNPVLDRPMLAARWWKYLIMPIAVVALLLSLTAVGPVFRDTLRYSLQGAALTFFFAAAIRLHDWGPFRALNWPVLAFIGVLSYSLYLVHHTIIFGVQRAYPSVNPLAQAVASFAISTALAWLMYTVVETPCARLRKRLTD